MKDDLDKDTIGSDSDDSEDEALNAKEHKTADLGHMFEMDGVEYDDEDDSGREKKPKSGFNFYKENNSDFDDQDDEDILDGQDDENDDSDSNQDDLGPDLSAFVDKHTDNDLEQDQENAQDDDMIATFSSSNDVEKEVLKGKAIENQQQIWDGLLELRIGLQKCLTKINQFPQGDSDWKAFKEAATNDDTAGEIKKSQSNLAKILDHIFQLKSVMLQKNPMIENESSEASPAKKRKLADYDKCLEANFESLKEWRNTTIEDWNDRTRITDNAAKKTSNGFSGFETSAVRQIEHILSDKSRLVKRTQLKRTAYDILGQENIDDEEHNLEIFDDDDFYHQLLRELIERKTAGVTDPIALGQQWIQLQKLRSKAKKKVDTRASKGRKTRYDIHSKLVNFMAPTYPKSTLTDEAKNELFASLFKGQNLAAA
jgi:protein AATF/BFR2